MKRADYERLMIALGIAVGSVGPHYSDLLGIFALVNMLNEGNPHFSPYQVAPPPKKH